LPVGHWRDTKPQAFTAPPDNLSASQERPKLYHKSQ